ncbi:multidrug efflux RND transporter permease subunit [Cystobacter fuscus]|uniref:multidrug efflux RND transporter permease subunit n=1 Tax=Cystobacter fuscus TaxID=43 RepID=UPI002B2E36AF|nr:multidrug efflux RND transporter permease subunit [Cystobacter fuscus]
MPRFFIDRPIFAWVIALFIIMAGLLAIPNLPVAQYPSVAPPQITISTFYPGASPEDLYQSVTRIIEEELNGTKSLLYFESSSDATGAISITATFAPGTDPALAAVDLQNRVKRVEPRLPLAVSQQGLQIEEAGSGFLLMVTLRSTDGSVDEIGLGDYLSRNVLNELRRIPGVGRAQLFSFERAMRIWVDPNKLLGLGLSSQDVTNAIRSQNAQVAAGSLGSQPGPVTQQVAATVLVKGQLTSPEEFGAIVLRANADGSSVRLRDVARVELGGQSYAISSRLNGQPSAAIGVQLSPTGNALATSTAIRAKLQELSRFFPKGVEYDIPYDTAPFVGVSIKKVLQTLVEAVLLVFLVMFLFLQNIRYTIIPTIIVPIALLGTCAVMFAMGFSINVLTMFAMVLAIGILVDDAIVVIENVERIMSEEGLSPREATQKAMQQITGAVIGITLVLSAVFVPMAFFPGSVGVIYKQFSLTMVVSILFSALLALSLTPALCATFLKPVVRGHAHARTGFFGWFNRGFERTSHVYRGLVGRTLHRAGRFMLVYVAVFAALGWLFVQLPSSFIPGEDQGFIILGVQAPPEATANRTLDVVVQMEKTLLAEPGVDGVLAIMGFSFFGQGQNAALSFATLKPWEQRGAEDSAEAIAWRMNGALSAVRDAFIFALSPPPIEGLGTSGGFSFRLEDRGGMGQEALAAARDQLLAAAAQSPVLSGVMFEGLANAPQVELRIDREKASALGLTFAEINETLSTNLGSAYSNDFPNAGRMQRVIVQAEGSRRMQPEDLLALNVRNRQGTSVPLSAFATVDWRVGATQVIGYNGYPSARISGNAAPGHSSGEALQEMERLASQLPRGFGFDWSGQSLQELQSGSQAPFLIGLSMLFVFLCLAALYESWSIPVAVMLVVPLGVLGSVLAVMFRGMSNDVYFKVGLITIIGLSAKNAILIIEFAKELRAQGRSITDAALEAAQLRFRPILMTSLAFTLGVVPLAIANGPGAASQRAIGTGVLGGMLSATVLAVLFVPIFYVFIMRLLNRRAVEIETLRLPDATD